MSTALLWIIALGTLPAVPEDLGFVEPCNPFAPRDDAAAWIAPPEDPTPAPVIAASGPASIAMPRPTRAHPLEETLRFQVAYGMLGGLGDVKVTFAAPDAAIRASGSGSGSFFGLGKVEKSFQAVLLPGQPAAQRWVSTRVQSGKVITDTIEQAKPGHIAVTRRRSDRPDEGHQFARNAPVLDPLALLWRLRQDPPAREETIEVLDGRALWLITLAPTRTVTASATRTVLVVTGKAAPIFWDGKPDDERTARAFTLWIEDDARRTPLRLVMPLAIGQVQVDLQSITHRPATPAARGQVATLPVVPAARPLAPTLVKNVAR